MKAFIEQLLSWLFPVQLPTIQRCDMQSWLRLECTNKLDPFNPLPAWASGAKVVPSKPYLCVLMRKAA